jgi:hypothetical protein
MIWKKRFYNSKQTLGDVMSYQIYGITSSDVSLQPQLIQEFQLELIKHQNIAAVVSVGTNEIGSSAERVLELYRRQTSILAQLQAEAVIPTRFGTGISSLAQIGILLEHNHDDLLAQLDGVRGRVQFNIVGRWQFDAVLRQVAQHPDVLDLRAQLQQRGQVTLEDQAHVGELIALHLEHERQRLFDKALLALEGMMHEYKTVARDSEDSAFVFSVLAKRASHACLLEKLAQMSKDADTNLEIAVSAPMPINQFRLLEVIEPRTTDLEQARQTLRLPTNMPSAPSQVWRAYKQLALEKHPDRRPNDPTAHDEMAALSRARDLLEVAGSGVGLRLQKYN